VVASTVLRHLCPGAAHSSAMCDTLSSKDGPVALGRAPVCVTVGKGRSDWPIEVADTVSPSLPSSRPPAIRPDPSVSLGGAAPATVAFGELEPVRVGSVTLSSSGSGAPTPGEAPDGRGATGAGAGTAAVGAGERDRSAMSTGVALRYGSEFGNSIGGID
jgi:hypothetical protein